MENLPTPNDREEKILYAIATGDTDDMPTPRTRSEKLLMSILEHGGMGGGTSFGILGYYATADILISSVTDPKTGDAYGVGSSAPYEMYVYDGVNNTWVNNGTMIQGPEGPEGPQGPQGLEGEQGPQGDPGTTYTPIIGTIQTVDNIAGASASVVVDGTTKKAKFNFNIPQGPTGSKGDSGEQGEKGEKGDTYTFEIGNVITVDSFEQASANISLDETNKKAILNISLPRGMTGQQGDKGDPGDPGIQGLRGEQGLQGPPGEQGPPGVQGEQGIQGIQGEKGNDGYPFLIYKEYADISEFTPADFPEVGLMFMVKSWVEDRGYPIYRFAEDRTNYSLVTYMNTEGIKGETGPQGPQGDQGVPGVAGRDGRDGVTYTPEIGVIRTVESSASASVTIELKEDEGRAIFNFDIPKGTDGINGINGINGVDGVSPTVEVVPTATGYIIKITDKDGVKSFDVNNGTNGQDGTNGTDGTDGQNGADGFSPVVTVTDIEGGHNVAIEDKNGVKNFEVLDGKDAEVSQYGLVTNAQNFKIDITKNNAYWYGFFTFSFMYGTTPCEITVSITNSVYYTITKGQNLVSALTYTQDGANYTFGIDFTAKIYGTQVVEMAPTFGVVNSFTAETYAGDTTADLKLDGARTYTTLAELGLNSSATIQNVMDALPVGGSCLIRTDAFDDTTQFMDVMWGYLKIEKTVNGLSKMEINDVISDNKLYIGKQSMGKFNKWVALATITSLSQLGLTASATLNDVIAKLGVGQDATLRTTEFTNYQTLFPYEEEQDANATVRIEKGYDNNGSRTIVTWVRKDASKVAYGGMGSNNQVIWWNEYALKSYVDSKIANLQAQINALK